MKFIHLTISQPRGPIDGKSALIIQTNYDPVRWRIYASYEFNELTVQKHHVLLSW